MGSKPVGIYSASGISAILGLNPYTTRLHAWQLIMEKLEPGYNEKRGYILPEFPDNAPIRWGHGFEGAIIQLAEQREVSSILKREQLYERKLGSVTLTCHIDGEISSGVLHEGKTTWTRAFYSIKGEDCTDDTGKTDLHRRWGDPGTDQVPAEYQVQAAVQRICTGAELVKLSVLVFPKSTDEFEELGWEVVQGGNRGEYYIHKKIGDRIISRRTLHWASVLAEMGFFHTYNLPTNKKLETLIIKKVKEFDKKYVKTKLPPKFENYADVRRLITQPMGTIVADKKMVALSSEYSEIVRQTGAKGPMTKRKEALKVELMAWMSDQKKDDWNTPDDKLVLVNPDGGQSLIGFSKSGFRAKRA